MARNFINKVFLDDHTPTTEPYSVVNSVEIRGSEKYLVLTEVPVSRDHEFLTKQKLDACDVICFLYDSSDANSFSYIAKLRVNLI